MAARPRAARAPRPSLTSRPRRPRFSPPFSKLAVKAAICASSEASTGPVLGDLLVGHEALRPHHGTDPDAAEGEAEEHALQLRLAPEGVDDGQAQGREDRHDEGGDGRSFGAPARRGVVAAGAHGCAGPSVAS
jgi:hypothetical protein